MHPFSSPGLWPGELLPSLGVRRPSVVRRKLSHLNLLLRNHWANCNQPLVEWSLGIHVKTPPTKTPPFLPKRPHFYQSAPTFYQDATVFFTKTPPLFFRISYFTKTLPLFYCQNGTFNNCFLLKRRYMYHVWCFVIQDLSSKFIYCVYMYTYLSYIGRQRTCIYMYTLR
jgi:hypothetical protein